MDPINKYNGLKNYSNHSSFDDIELEALNEPYQTILVVIYIITAIMAFICNITAVSLLISGKRSSPELKKYLFNLFSADILMALFSIPFTYTDFMYGQWIFPLILCPITQFLTSTAVIVSVYTLIAIGIERYFAIVYPFEQLIGFERHTKLVITTVWIIGIVLSCPQLIQSRAVEFSYRNQILYDCRELWEQELSGKVYTAIIFFTTFLIPLIVLTILYLAIGLTAFRTTVPGNDNPNGNQVTQQNRIKMVKMLVILVISFLICWLPIQLFNMVMWLCDSCRSLQTELQVNLYVATYFFCHFLSMIHALVDPIIYCFMSYNFRLIEIRLLMYRICVSTNRESKHRERIETTEMHLNSSKNPSFVYSFNENETNV